VGHASAGYTGAGAPHVPSEIAGFVLVGPNSDDDTEDLMVRGLDVSRPVNG
jgi:hypothetical protein